MIDVRCRLFVSLATGDIASPIATAHQDMEGITTISGLSHTTLCVPLEPRWEDFDIDGV